MEENNKKKTSTKKTGTKTTATKKASTGAKKTTSAAAAKSSTTKKVAAKTSTAKAKAGAKKETKPTAKNVKAKKERKVRNEMSTEDSVFTVVKVIAMIIVLALLAFVISTVIRNANYETKNPVATMEVENFGTVTIELYPDVAPNTVANFIKLANSGFYDGLTFHRTIPDFMIQGGDKNGDGTGSASLKDLDENNDDEEYNIEGEFILNNFSKNTLKHKRGVISMARSDYSSAGSSTLVKKGYNTASSQFFIMVKDNNNLDGAYAAFGEVIEGMEVVDKIVNVEVETRDSSTTSDDEESASLTQDKPIDPPVIKSIRVETYGVDYGMPETIEPFDYNSYLMQQYGSSY